MVVFNLKRIVFWLIGFSPTLLMLALLIYVVVEEVFLSPGPCIGRGCALGEAVLAMALLAALVMTWVAHAIEVVIVLLIRKEKGRVWLASVAGMAYLNIRKLLISWALAYPIVMWLLMSITLSVVWHDNVPNLP